jgi:hypothetical protein
MQCKCTNASQTPGVLQFIMSLHLLCIHDIYLVHMHAIGVSEGVTLLEFEGLNPEEHPATEEQEVQAQEGVNDEELPECPNHQPSSFIQGQPRSILSLLCFAKYNLSILYVGLFEILHDFVGLPELYGLKYDNLITSVIIFIFVFL